MNRFSFTTVAMALFLALIFTACSSTRQQSRQGSATAESFTMQVQEDPEFYDKLSVARARGQGNARGILSPITGNVVSLAKGAILNLIKKEEKRLTRNYKQAQTDLFFYNAISRSHSLDPTGMQFDGLEVVRYTSGSGDRRDTSFFASFSVDTSRAVEILNNSIFRLKLDELQVNATNLPSTRRWFLPWTWFDKPAKTVNLDVSIKVYASWIDESLNMKRNESMGEFYLVLRDVPIRGSSGYEAYIESQEGTQLTGYSYLVPRSVSFQELGNRVQKIYGHGLYSLEVDITESRQRGKVATTATSVIEKSGALN